MANFPYKELHEAVRKKYVKNDNVETKKIQDTLNRLYRHIKKDQQSSKVPEFRTNLLKQFYYNLRVQDNDFATFLSYDSELNNETGRAAGQRFEKEFTQLLNAALEKGIQSIGVSGQNQATTEFFQINGQDLETFVDTTKILVNYGGKIIQTTIGEIKKSCDKNSDIKIAIAPGTQKADVSIQVGSNFIYQGLETLRGANISLKNYANISEVHLGSSSYIRVVSSIFLSLDDKNYWEPKIGWFYGETKGNISKKSQGYEHKQHIRFVYELTGDGQISTKGGNQRIGQIDYLIIFNKANQGIDGAPFIVLSASNMLKKYFDNSFGFSNTINVNNFLT